MCAQLLKKRLGFLQVLRVEALGEPGVDGLQQRNCFLNARLRLQQARIAGGRAQLMGCWRRPKIDQVEGWISVEN
jgi:hypothetical protein